MHLAFSISFREMPSFIEHWYSKYEYPAEETYTDNIDAPPSKERLMALFEWKNGTGEKIAAHKLKSIVNNYPWNLAGDQRARYLDHRQAGGAIWNIFFLHCLDPKVWPIFDQHTFRAMYYMKTEKIREIGSTNKKKYEEYVEYRQFVADIKEPNQRKIDRALFAFGKFLKSVKPYVPVSALARDARDPLRA
jgi:hypothetical protein